MTITELAQKLDIPASTLRYYEQIGLITAGRQANGNRDYDSEQAERARRIMLFKRAGVSIADLKQLFANSMTDEVALDMLADAKARIAAQMSQLEATMAFLDYKTAWHQAQLQNKRMSSAK